jgi:hypothetical protein
MEFEGLWWQYLQLEVNKMVRLFKKKLLRPMDHFAAFTGAGAIAPCLLAPTFWYNYTISAVRILVPGYLLDLMFTWTIAACYLS